MSYENRFNELTVTILNKNGKIGDLPLEFEMSVNYVDADSMAVPEVNVFFITKSQNEFEDDLQDELTSFAQHAKNREKFLTKQELTLIYDESTTSFSFQKEDDGNEEYIKTGGVKCPFCKSQDIEGLDSEFDQGECIQNVKCHTCEKSWTDVYRLVSLTI